MPGRWASTRYAVGDKVKYKGLTYEVERIEQTRGPDRHSKPMYVLRRGYLAIRPRGKSVKCVHRAYSSATNLRKAS